MKKRILVADDEPNIVVSLKFLLESENFIVLTEANGQAALDRVLSDPPDVLILDIMLPDKDGFEILKSLRSDPLTRRLPILMLTAKGQSEDRKRAMELGADTFISKPFANSDVVAAVHKLAANKRA